MADFDLVVLGSGPGGYVAAIRSAQLGMKTAVVEKEAVGGICLNWGCIPSKALLRNAEVINLFNQAEDFGVVVEDLRYDLGKAIDRSRGVVEKLTNGVAFLLRKNKIDYIEGSGVLEDERTVTVLETGKKLSTNNVIVATGARPRHIENLPVDGKLVITSREALEVRELPKRVIIVGGGPIGVEFAYFWRTYGAEVTIVEVLPRLVPLEDEEISQQLERSFEKQGIKIMTSAQVTGVQVDGKFANVTVADDSGMQEIKCDKVLVGVGSRGNVEGLGLEDIGIEMDRGYISVDDGMQTNIPGVYAIGDVTGKLPLAHVASAQGVVAVEHIAGLNPSKLNYDLMPKATYCRPQIASFGLTEKQARESGFDVRVGKFPMIANGKALALGDTEGIVKIVVDAEIGDILGAHMIGPEVTELLGELSMANMLESTTKELGWLVHPHPTISETIKEAALAADGEAIHIV